MKRKTQLAKKKQQSRKSYRDSVRWAELNKLKQTPPENHWAHKLPVPPPPFQKRQLVQSKTKPENVYRVIQAGPRRLKLSLYNSPGYFSCYCRPCDVVAVSYPFPPSLCSS